MLYIGFVIAGIVLFFGSIICMAYYDDVKIVTRCMRLVAMTGYFLAGYSTMKIVIPYLEKLLKIVFF